MKRSVPSLLSIAALLATACGDAPMQPETSAISPRSARFSVAGAAAGTALDFAGDIEGITTIVLPSLDDAAAAEKLRADFAKLSAALDAGSRADAAGTVAAIRAQLKPEIGGVGDVGAIALVLDNIELALN